jgi:hypothetical protein
MKINAFASISASVVAFLLATSCCWLPALAALIFGSAVGATAFSEKLETWSGVFFMLGGAAAGLGIWKITRRFFQKGKTNLVLESRLTCPHCGFQKTEMMPTDACQFFYECENCKTVLRPLAGDCCVFCSFGTVKCPPIQTGVNCC